MKINGNEAKVKRQKAKVKSKKTANLLIPTIPIS
jgi:hypothetical protein